MQTALAGLDSNTIIMIVIGIVVYVIRGGTGGDVVDQILDMLAKILNRPQRSSSECTHDLDKVEGLVMAVKSLQDKLTEVGESDLVTKLDAAMPKLVTSQRAKM